MLFGDTYIHTAIEGLITGAVTYLGTRAAKRGAELIKSKLRKRKPKKQKPKP